MPKNVWIIVLAFVGIVGVIGVVLMLRTPTQSDVQSIAASSTVTDTAQTNETSSQLLPIDTTPREKPKECGQMAGADCQEYRSERYRFSLFHPNQQKVKEYDEGSGARTIVFENTDGARGFQIFIVPYNLPQVTPERFKKDVPSGVRTDELAITVDGVLGDAFYSKDMFLGDTREVWFIHNGYLYEVTAPKSQDNMLGAIMLSWKFI